MQGWERLGEYVVARRVQLGYDLRPDFAAAAQITTRVMSDIENGKRDNFDKVTVAKLEAALGWETGSVTNVVAGGEPRIKGEPLAGDTLGGPLDYHPTRDEAIQRVMRSTLPDAKKRQIIGMLNAERDAAERRRVEQADELIRILGEQA